MKKNIVLILSDDQGAWAMHCAGNEDLITPNLDRLAKMGARFTNFFCASPVCSPARASIMTGEMPSSHGVLDWLSGGNMNTKDYPYMKDHEHFQTEDQVRLVITVPSVENGIWGIRFIRKRDLRNGTPSGLADVSIFIRILWKMEDSIMKNGM